VPPSYRMAFSTMALDGKLPHGDPRWKAFNASFENEEVTAVGAAWMISDGRAFTTWHANQWRSSENFTCGQHLGVDFDLWGMDRALADPFVDEFAAIVYPTPSSTPEAPRCRAVFLLDTPIVQAANYVRAATALIWAFGGQADRKCKDATRFFYGSAGCMPVRREKVLPLAKVKALITQAEAAQPPKRERPPDYTPRASDAQDAKRLLERLNPTRADDYGDWITVGMALHTIGAEGLYLWDAWSAHSAKHAAGECARKWETFSDGGNGITMASVGKMAREDGR
jgi:hypothetical protein